MKLRFTNYDLRIKSIIVFLFLVLSASLNAQGQRWIDVDGTIRKYFKIGKDAGEIKWLNDSTLYQIRWLTAPSTYDSAQFVYTKNPRGNNLYQNIEGRKWFKNYVIADTLLSRILKVGVSDTAYTNNMGSEELAREWSGSPNYYNYWVYYSKNGLAGRQKDTLASQDYVRDQIAASTFQTVDTSNYAYNIIGGAANKLVKQTAANTTGFVDAPTATGQILQYNGSNIVWGVLDSTKYATRYWVTSNYVPTSRTISTTSPLSGGGSLSSNLTLTIANAEADGITKGAASFTASDFNATAGNISIDWTNTYSGYLSTISSNVQTQINNITTSLSGYVPTSRTITLSGTTKEVELSAGAQDLSANRTWTIGLPDTIRVEGITSLGDLILDPLGNDVLPRNNYDINLGSITNKYLSASIAELFVSNLVALNTVASFGGRIMTTEANEFIADVNTSQTTIDVKYNNYASGDRVLSEANGAVEYFAITSAPTTITGGYRYSVTRNLDGTGANSWYKGDAIVSTGTTGDGWIEQYAVNSLKGVSQPGPTIAGNVRNSLTYNDWSEVFALGNLNGLYGYSSNIYGLGIGKYANSSSFITVDPTNGIRLRYKDSGGSITDKITLDASGNATFSGTVNATSGKFGTATNYWSVGATGLTAVSSSTDVIINYGKTDFGQDATNGFILGYDFSASKSKFEIGSSATKLFKYDGTDLSLIGATITAGTIQTSTGTTKIMLEGSSNSIKIYSNSNLVATLRGYYWSPAGTDIFEVSGSALWSTGNIYVNTGFVGVGSYVDADGGFLGGTSNQFIVNTSGQITKVDNLSPTAGLFLRGNGTSFSPLAIQAGDLPTSIDAIKIGAGGVTSTEFGYLGSVTSDIQTQINSKQATITGGATTIDTENLTASKILTSDASGKVAASSIASSELFTPAYGELYDAIATSTINTNGSTYVKWSGSTVGDYKNVTGNTTNDYLTVDAGNAGKYYYSYSVTFTANTIGDYYWAILHNASGSAETRKAIYVEGTNLIHTVAGDGILNLSAGDTIGLGCYSNNGRVVTVIYANISITKLSN